MKKKKERYWAIVCDEAGVCGALATRREAKEFNENIEDCPATHKILPCEIKLIPEKHK